MRLLLDTHALLWFVLGESRCSATARSTIESGENQAFVSPASHWEIAIKVSLGKYSIPGTFQEFFEAAINANGFRVLPIEPKHTATLVEMPYHHRDPFDRLIVAQAITEQMTLRSSDKALDAYGVTRLW